MTATVEAGLAGRLFKRRVPLDPDDGFNVLEAVGAVDVGGEAGPIAELCVRPVVTFGPVESVDLATFAASYRNLSEAERAVLAVSAAADAQEATAAAEADPDREHPWAYVAQNERRTGKGGSRS